MKIGFWNIQHLSNKIDQLKVYLGSDNLNSDIMFMAETFLNSSDCSNDFFISDFLIERKDRVDRGGGGLMLYIRSKVLYTRRLDLESPDLEIMWIEVSPPNCSSFLIAGVYRPPDTLHATDVRIEQNLERGYLLGKEMYVLGDFNIDLLTNKGQRHFLFLSLCNLNFKQLVEQPTRPVSKTCIDHIYASNCEHVSKIVIPEIGLSDHYPVICIRKLNSNHEYANSHVTMKFRSFTSFNNDSFLHDLAAASWELVDLTDNIDIAMSMWNAIFNKICDMHAPYVVRRVKRFSQPGWMSSEIRDAMNKRDKLLKQANLDRTKLIDYRLARNVVVHMIKKAKRDHLIEVLSKNGSNASAVWKLYNNIAKPKDFKNPPMVVNGTTLSEHCDIANAFNEYFVNISKSV